MINNNQLKGLLLFAIIYFSVLGLSFGINLFSHNSTTSIIFKNQTHQQIQQTDNTNIIIMIIELIVISIVAMSEKKWHLISRLIKYLKENKDLNKYKFIGVFVVGLVVLVENYFYPAQFNFLTIFLGINAVLMSIVYFTLKRRYKINKISAGILFFVFVILFPIFFIFHPNGVEMLILGYGYFSITFGISIYITHNTTKKIINGIAFFSSLVVAVMIGIMFNPLYALLFLGLFAVYDFIAVFITKHMIFMAEKFVNMNIPEVFFIGVKDNEGKYIFKRAHEVKTEGIRPMIIGTGDAIIPAALISSLAFNNLYLLSIFAAVGGVLGLYFNIIVLNKYNKPLPAIPLIFVGMLLMLGVGVLV